VPLRSRPTYNDTKNPEVLRDDLLTNAAQFHEEFDAYAIPLHIRVVQIAGWGLSTIKGIEYVESHGELDHVLRWTTEGDSTVVYPSAVSSSGETYYFNLDLYGDIVPGTQHRNLPSAEPVLNAISSIIYNDTVPASAYFQGTKPNPANLEDKLLVSVHSPMTLGAYDGQARFTGITPGQDANADLLTISEDIPGSSYYEIGEDKYILLPIAGAYTFELQGTASGSATIQVQRVSSETITDIATFPDIPVSNTTDVSFDITSENPVPKVEVDKDGNGDTDYTLPKPKLTVTADNQTVVLGQVLPTLTATLSGFIDDDTASTTLGAADCTTVIPSGVGSYPITCTIGTLFSDKYDFETFVPGTLTVIYKWDGFLQPINDTGHQVGQSLSVFKAGSTIPIKFQLKNSDGSSVQASTTPIWLPPQKGSSMSASVDESVYSDPGTSGNAFKWDSVAKQYTYNWSTKGFAAGYWYRLYAQLDDGKTYSVTVGLR
jgi:hypothetical protein